jgi:class 3 adenylate cyclase
VVWARRVPRESGHQAAQSGRVVTTVLFTDIVGSTERAAELGDRPWGQLLKRYEDHSRRLVPRFGGRIVKTLGDGLLAIFESPRDAILCAKVLRDDLKADGIDIRARLHIGEVELRGPDIGGIGVHIASRIMAAAGTGRSSRQGLSVTSSAAVRSPSWESATSSSSSKVTVCLPEPSL